jgi:hypothetical protein
MAGMPGPWLPVATGEASSTGESCICGPSSSHVLRTARGVASSSGSRQDLSLDTASTLTLDGVWNEAGVVSGVAYLETGAEVWRSPRSSSWSRSPPDCGDEPNGLR